MNASRPDELLQDSSRVVSLYDSWLLVTDGLVYMKHTEPFTGECQSHDKRLFTQEFQPADKQMLTGFKKDLLNA